MIVRRVQKDVFFSQSIMVVIRALYTGCPTTSKVVFDQVSEFVRMRKTNGEREGVVMIHLTQTFSEVWILVSISGPTTVGV